MCKFLCGHIFISLGYVARGGMAGSHGSSILHVVRAVPEIFVYVFERVHLRI